MRVKVGEIKVKPVGEVIWENDRYAVSKYNDAILVQQILVPKYAIYKERFSEKIRVATVVGKPKTFLIPANFKPSEYVGRLGAPNWVINCLKQAGLL